MSQPDEYGKESRVLTIEEWVERFAKTLARDVKIHIESSDDPVRHIMTSIRQWNDKGCVCANTKATIMGKGGFACEQCGKKRKHGDHLG